MAIKRRINPKTGNEQFRSRYFWKDENGKTKDSMTRWCSSQKEADAEAKTLKEAKIALAKENKILRNSKLVKTVMEEWIKELSEYASRDTMDNTTTDVTKYQRAITLFKYHTPAKILNLHTREMTVDTFREWLDYINRKDLGGLGVRNQRQAINSFNQFCANKGYYISPSLDLDIDLAIQRVRLKPKKAGKRKRYCPTVKDIEKITDQYYSLGLDKFENMYWYTLFMVLFYSGMRVEELVGLQWKSVHFNVKRPYIDIQNAISERESRDNVMKRVKAEVYSVKNARSEREIPIFHKYYSLLERFKLRSSYEFGVRDIDELFVFPNINAKDKKRVLDYQKHKNILRELNRVTEACGVEKTDSQMFRHGCATWLVTDKEHGGCGFSPAQAKDYFGHTSDEMINECYAKLNKRQRANRTSETFKEMSTIHLSSIEDSDIEENKQLTQKAMDEDLNHKDKEDAIIGRIYMEMTECKRKGYDYHLSLADLFYITKGMHDNKDFATLANSIKLVLDKTNMDDVYMADNNELLKKLK